MEIMKRFASYLGKEFVPVDMPFNSLLLAVATGKADVAVSCITITEERAKTVSFSDKYYECSVSIIADMSRMTHDNAAEFMPSKMQSEKKDFFKKIGESFHNNLVQENRYKLVLDGLAVTVIISLLAAILGTLQGGSASCACRPRVLLLLLPKATLPSSGAHRCWSC